MVLFSLLFLNIVLFGLVAVVERLSTLENVGMMI
jgi:hypothetical protein